MSWAADEVLADTWQPSLKLGLVASVSGDRDLVPSIKNEDELRYLSLSECFCVVKGVVIDKRLLRTRWLLFNWANSHCIFDQLVNTIERLKAKVSEAGKNRLHTARKQFI